MENKILEVLTAKIEKIKGILDGLRLAQESSNTRVGGLPNGMVYNDAKETYEERKELPDSAFADEKARKYLLIDPEHAQLAIDDVDKELNEGKVSKDYAEMIKAKAHKVLDVHANDSRASRIDAVCEALDSDGDMSEDMLSGIVDDLKGIANDSKGQLKTALRQLAKRIDSKNSRILADDSDEEFEDKTDVVPAQGDVLPPAELPSEENTENNEDVGEEEIGMANDEVIDELRVDPETEKSIKLMGKNGVHPKAIARDFEMDEADVAKMLADAELTHENDSEDGEAKWTLDEAKAKFKSEVDMALVKIRQFEQGGSSADAREFETAKRADLANLEDALAENVPAGEHDEFRDFADKQWAKITK